MNSIYTNQQSRSILSLVIRSPFEVILWYLVVVYPPLDFHLKPLVIRFIVHYGMELSRNKLGQKYNACVHNTDCRLCVHK